MIRVYQWAWQHSDGTRTGFSKFWSATNPTKNNKGCNCKWYQEVGAFECDYCHRYGYNSIVGGPLGPENTTYYERPEDNETWGGPFANGTWALKGHCRLCGQHAYWRLPLNWSGIRYIGYTKPFFFLLSQAQGNQLGDKVYDELIREKQLTDTSLTKGSSQSWGKRWLDPPANYWTLRASQLEPQLAN